MLKNLSYQVRKLLNNSFVCYCKVEPSFRGNLSNIKKQKMTNHQVPVYLSYGKSSVAYFSIHEATNLLVFVHGFNGDTLKTWTGFIEQIITDRDFSNSDILFYGYSTFESQAYTHSTVLTKDLNEFLEKYDINYKKIIIIGHSLGAIITRYAVINAYEKKYKWAEKIKIYLFAPAHNGARIQNLIFLGLPSFTKLLGSVILYKYPIIDDLKPGSLCLERLEKKVKSYCGTAFEKNLIAYILEAKNDKIVHNNYFCFDIHSDNSPVKKSHTSICKPKKKYYEIPIIEIKKLL